MIIILFGALSAGTKIYLLCRSDTYAFTSAFCNTLPVGCLKFCLSLEIRSSVCPFLPLPSKMIELKFPVQPIEMHTGQQLHMKVINFIPVNSAWLFVFRTFCNQISQLGIWNDRKVTSDYMAIWLI